MRRFRLVTCVLGLLFSFVPLRAAPAAQPSAAAAIETTLPTEGEHIRQLAFDGDEKTYFASARNAGGKDHFTLVLG